MKLVWALISFVVIGWFINSYTENQAKRQADKEAAQRLKQEREASLSELVTRSNAISDWEIALSRGEKFRFETVLTIELEKIWIKQRPILFVGSIKDIVTHDDSLYNVTVERNLYASFDHMFYTELQLYLLANKKDIDSFLDQHTDLFGDHGFNNGVAVVAMIQSIETDTLISNDGERTDVRIGVGELVDILYIGEAL